MERLRRYDKTEWEKFAGGTGGRPTPRGSSIADCSAWFLPVAEVLSHLCIPVVGKLSKVKKGRPEMLGVY